MYYSNNGVTITEHAMKRLSERNGWSKATSIRMAGKIFEQGKRAENLAGYRKIWVNDKEEMLDRNRELVIYGDYAYVFDKKDACLITAFTVPSRSSMRLSWNKKNDCRPE